MTQDGWERTDRGWRKVYRAPVEPSAARSALACPMVIGDTMEPTQHVDGNHYTSKSQFRAVTKAKGFVEVGNDPARHVRPPKPKPDTAAIRQSVAKAMAQHNL